MFTIDTTIDIAAPLSSVRTAITTEAGYRAWWRKTPTSTAGKARFGSPGPRRRVRSPSVSTVATIAAS